VNEPTLDADIVVVGREDGPPPVVVYRRVSTNDTWAVSGTCNQCGLCVIGAVGEWYVWNGPPGTPGASSDTRVPGRADDPVCPGFIEDMQEMAAVTPTANVAGCSLVIETR
jgi:hypothetical protein